MGPLPRANSVPHFLTIVVLPSKTMGDTKEHGTEVESDETKEITNSATFTGTNPSELHAKLSGLMQSPAVLAALQNRLDSMVGTPSGYIQSLPKVVKRRVKALKKLQKQMLDIESKFYEEVHELECKYASQHAPLYEKRKNIVTAELEPTDSDCDWPSDEEEELSVDLTKKVAIKETEKEKESEKEKDENPPGISLFWLTIFKNVDMLAEMIQECDEPILEQLRDITVEFKESNPMGFNLHFHFNENEYFTNSILSKFYIMRSTPDEEDPFSFEGPEIIKCTGCKIDWKKGKNVTVKTIKKTQKHQSRGTKRVITKTVQKDSFFNFFSPPDVEDGTEPDEDVEALLSADFEIGHFIRERIVPRAVLYFTGEALEDDDDDFGEEECDDEDEGEMDEENDADFQP